MSTSPSFAAKAGKIVFTKGCKKVIACNCPEPAGGGGGGPPGGNVTDICLEQPGIDGSWPCSTGVAAYQYQVTFAGIPPGHGLPNVPGCPGGGDCAQINGSWIVTFGALNAPHCCWAGATGICTTYDGLGVLIHLCRYQFLQAGMPVWGWLVTLWSQQLVLYAETFGNVAEHDCLKPVSGLTFAGWLDWPGPCGVAGVTVAVAPV